MEAIGKLREDSTKAQKQTKRDLLMEEQSFDYESLKDTYNQDRTPGTGEWLLQDDSFCRWRCSQESCILWVNAGPGCGKSVLAKALVDEHLISGSIMACTVCYFSFKRGEQESARPRRALRAILHQLFRDRADIDDFVRFALARYKDHGNKLKGLFRELWAILIDTIQ